MATDRYEIELKVKTKDEEIKKPEPYSEITWKKCCSVFVPEYVWQERTFLGTIEHMKKNESSKIGWQR